MPYMRMKYERETHLPRLALPEELGPREMNGLNMLSNLAIQFTR